jgi:hypothetical protein
LETFKSKLAKSTLLKVKNAQSKSHTVVVIRKGSTKSVHNLVASTPAKVEAKRPSPTRKVRHLSSGGMIERAPRTKTHLLDQLAVTAIIGPRELPKSVESKSPKKRATSSNVNRAQSGQYAHETQLVEPKLDARGLGGTNQFGAAATSSLSRKDGALPILTKAQAKPKTKKKAKKKRKSIRLVSGGGANGTGVRSR